MLSTIKLMKAQAVSHRYARCSVSEGVKTLYKALFDIKCQSAYIACLSVIEETGSDTHDIPERGGHIDQDRKEAS